MKHTPIILLALLLLSCGNSKSGKINEPIDGGHGIGIDTATVHQIERHEDSAPAKETVDESPKTVSSPSSLPSSRDDDEPDNMRGFDPASEDDMDDNGMSRYMENNDDEGWD